MSVDINTPLMCRKVANLCHLKKLFRKLKEMGHICLTRQDTNDFGFFAPQPAKSVEKLPKAHLKGYVAPDPKWGPFTAGLHLNYAIDGDLRREIPEASRMPTGEYALYQYCNWRGNSSVEELLKADNGVREFVPRFGSYEWRKTNLWLPENDDYPHMVLVSVHNFEADGSTDSTVLRGEAILVARMLLWRMMLVAYTKVRVVQAYFDGENLNMALSDFLDFSTRNEASWDLLLRWILCKPIGDTKIPTKTR
ncbi:hypothetical protein ACJ73_05106 [Blastomyces percursus]|uniref:Uncharacterized protein n=1 Tax=Blastomyces percursus TaxID=1658174 RepID=A0A1J9R7C1_9EURO|nr:hypothetical protein ACJ73_05106 [Blastomyces percursus]